MAAVHARRLVAAILARSPSVCRALAVAAVAVAGCTPTYVPEDRTDRREKVLRITSHAGGTHHATLVENGRWFQTFGNELMVIDVTNGRELGRVEGVKFGEGGSLTDIVVNGDTAWAVSSATALVEFDVSDHNEPKVTTTVLAAELGIEPELVSAVGDELFVSGRGGVVRIEDRKRFLTGQSPQHVVASTVGPVTCVGRRIVAVEDGRYLGAATSLQSLPAGVGPAGGYAFILQGQNGASVGLMTPAFSEATHAAVPAVVRRLRVCGDRMFAVTDRFLYAWRIEGNELVEPEEIPLKGGLDIALIRPNHYAVSGSFGRAMYRHKGEDRRDGDTFYNVERQPGMLEVAVTDGRRILAGGREGFWLWRIGGEPQITDKTTDLTTVQAPEVSAAWGGARIVREKTPEGLERGIAVEVRHDGQSFRHEPDGKPAIQEVEIIDGDVWIGHDRGVDVLRRVEVMVQDDPAKDAKKGGAPSGGAAAKGGAAPKQHLETRIEVINRWRFEGPVRFIYPERIGGGATMVSLRGGFVLVKPEAVGEAPVFKGRGEVE
jgi:hypothetical protein